MDHSEEGIGTVPNNPRSGGGECKEDWKETECYLERHLQRNML